MRNIQFQERRITFPFLIFHFFFFIFLTSCSVEKQIARSAKDDVLSNKALQTAHVGISIFDPATNKYLYNYQGDKYFIPASNTKLPTCYAAMKYLGDSLAGIRYEYFAEQNLTDNNKRPTLLIEATGDPSFLHKDFTNQPVFKFLKQHINSGISISGSGWDEQGLGSGWSWNDYQENYMAERSDFPIYGNLVRFNHQNNRITAVPKYFMKESIYDPTSSLNDEWDDRYTVMRELGSNDFHVTKTNHPIKNIEIPFTQEYGLIHDLLEDTLGVSIGIIFHYFLKKPYHVIYSQPTDSLLKPMMHRSDNFFAEQSLLMVSNERLGVMNDEKIIDTILKTDFKDLPQKPRWVDGSGLSRYNLFTPQDFVAILSKMKNEFGMERLKVILPTGGEGTISSYYKADSGYIYGKTGTLSGVVAFSGFLYTKKGKLLIFSTLINNHQSSATEVRRAIEKFIQGVRNKF
ncbi:MAG: D-alanyl-D-alanine carboxypeptidase/D-alanyl-D-alanine-endopeptidase [Chitinophagaceae bacterium]|nr:D-alanyl-D-alanine carboxypeptidase/D-alanyl-D-alanine-endopeptidase [Chitinophagaceae bacterium]MBL0271587.1 D-alanyl-D-alanine carboxypeptidase/D-alanyl-D-alanine-endopeptidase [Chitinophagaceae bacterium]